MKYAGLTDDLGSTKQQHGKHRNFRIIQQFTSQEAAHQWQGRMLGQGYERDAGGKGWKYGYVFST